MNIKNKNKPRLAQRFKTASRMTFTASPTTKNHFIDNEGYDPVYMYKSLSKIPVPSPQAWSARVKQAEQFVHQVTTAPFLDKFRLKP